MKFLKFFQQYRKVDLKAIPNAKLLPINAPLRSFNTLIATWFYIGLLGIAPGTLASLASYPLFYGIISSTFITTMTTLDGAFFGMAIITFFMGIWATSEYQKKTNTFDHSSVVIDEVAGMMLAFALCYTKVFKVSIGLMVSIGINMKPYNFAFLLVFVIFRFFDIYKPLLIDKIDKYVKNAFGVMVDDSLAAIYTAITIHILSRFF